LGGLQRPHCKIPWISWFCRSSNHLTFGECVLFKKMLYQNAQLA
jgi:hypothetical protein